MLLQMPLQMNKDRLISIGTNLLERDKILLTVGRRHHFGRLPMNKQNTTADMITGYKENSAKLLEASLKLESLDIRRLSE
ncbi:hypothetical protein MJO28_008373 [Puccinia striiformis f. sp. tritici]|uniref:Uncharacterized protein n=1 Tax=Puccinia striiformis f. sp. tritici TaxID=168172 RepID=A0ACC0EAU2_9BASI|nr:hypothetical protein MJO28_008373 [Puccinia striiformis f. sp. tritici]